LFFWNFKSGAEPLTFIQIRPFVVPMLFFIIPLIDTTTVTLRRLLRKQSPFIGGKDHITHHLAYLGLSDVMVAVILFTTSLISMPLVLLLITGYITWTPLATLAAFIYFAVVFLLFQVLYNLGTYKQKARLAAKQGQKAE
jgi:UDP-GlcNAc:undecaprenyl-phosphate GlcNAc-1-phosphate transferase